MSPWGIPFRLLDLPQEIQELIYTKYHEGTEIWAYAVLDRLPDSIFPPMASFHIDSLPSLAIELVSKKVHHDASAARSKVWSLALLIDNGNIETSPLLWLQASRKTNWLRNHITSLEIRQWDLCERPLPLDWVSLLRACPNLRTISLEVVRRLIGHLGDGGKMNGILTARTHALQNEVPWLGYRPEILLGLLEEKYENNFSLDMQLVHYFTDRTRGFDVYRETSLQGKETLAKPTSWKWCALQPELQTILDSMQ